MQHLLMIKLYFEKLSLCIYSVSSGLFKEENECSLVFIFNLSISVLCVHIAILLGDIRFGITQKIKMNVFNGDICIPLNGPSFQLNDFFSLDYCIHIVQQYPWGNNTLNLSLEVVGWPYTFFIAHKRC